MSRQTRKENQIFVRETREFIAKQAQKNSGKMVKTMGDGFLVTFESPTNAVKCGLDIQKEMDRRNANILDDDHFVRFRIGVCTGEVSIDDSGDVFGEAVNIAARIQQRHDGPRDTDETTGFITEINNISVDAVLVDMLLSPE